MHLFCLLLCFFFNYTATTEIYTLSLHDALPIYIFHGIDKAVADTWNNFWKDGKADGIGFTVFPEIVPRSEERFSRNAETDLVCRLLLEKKKKRKTVHYSTTTTSCHFERIHRCRV